MLRMLRVGGRGRGGTKSKVKSLKSKVPKFQSRAGVRAVDCLDAGRTTRLKSVVISPYGRARLVPFLASLLIAACPFLEAWSTTPVFFSSRTGWQTAVGQHTDVDFEGLAPSRGYTLYPTPPGLTLQG